MRINRTIISLLFVCLVPLNGSCSSGGNSTGTGGDTPTQNVTSVTLSTDKACYSPGETVTFTSTTLPSSAKVAYYYLGNKLSEETPSSSTWSWTPPSTDYQGYMVKVYTTASDGTETVLGSIAVDVSSDWTQFPRYGFLSSYDDMSASDINSVITSLKRYHINGLQFYDWQYKHHKPLAGTPDKPDSYWTDIANRNTSLATVKSYISAAHKVGMKTMFYNLCYGVLSDAASDGVESSWNLYKDRNHSNRDVCSLSAPMFKSSIYLVDPNNTGWQNYLAKQNDDVYSVFDFDGYHIDQLGDRGTDYDYNGNAIDMAAGFKSFIQAMKTKHPGKRLVMNAVARYGQQKIAESGDVDFLYNEVWSNDANYSSLKDIIDENASYGNYKTVFAAYMNYDKANNKGYFNTPGVVLADAVMFALGGSHLEMGEHMLGKEYFPNSNLQMDGNLQKAMVCYYDFLTGYENLLRNGGSFSAVDLSCTNGKMNVSAWPPSTGNVSVLAKKVNSKCEVIHLINLSNANYFSWRDLDGSMPEPSFISTPSLRLQESNTIKRIWFASPDIDGGASQELEFHQSAASVTFKLPSLKYWDMIVVEYQ